MIIFLLLFLIFISILIFKLINSTKRNTYLSKNVIITIFCTILIFNIILKPKICLNSALAGGKLFLNSVFVSIFPFLVIINIMLSYDGVNIYSKILGNVLCRPLNLPRNCSIVLIISILCGYPLGAKYACDLYEEKYIDYDTCERLISIASNPSPLFVLGVIGISMLNSNSLGFLLLISTYLSCLAMAIIVPSKKSTFENHNNFLESSSNKNTLGDILKSSIDNAFKTSFSIGGFIIFFSVLTSIIKNNIIFDIVFKRLSITVENFFLGLLEMTNGCNSISTLNIDIMYKVIIISFLLAFSGLSIISQTYSITCKINLPLGLYIKRKFIQGFICSIITLILYKLNIFNISKSTFSLQIFNYNGLNLTNIFTIELIVLIVPILIYKFIKLFNRIS